MNKTEYTFLNEVVYEHTLENGFHICLIPKKDFHNACGILSIDFGADTLDYMQDGSMRKLKSGIAHFLEHKMFEKQKGDFGKDFTTLGAYENAFTTYQQTAYQFTATENIEKCAQTLIELVSDFHVSKTSVEKEKKIIIQEILMYQDDYDYISYEHAVNNLYHVHPVKNDVCGSIESVKSITKEDLEEAYQAFYQPQNMTMVIVGNFDVDLVNEAIMNQASKLKNCSSIIKKIKTYKESKEVAIPYESIEIDDAIPKITLAMKLEMKDASPRGVLLFDLCMSLLTDLYFSKSSSFYDIWQKKELVNDSFSYDIAWGSDYGHFVIQEEGENLQAFKHCLLDFIDHIEEYEISDEDFEIVKNKNIGNYLLTFNSIESIANNYLDYRHYGLNLFEVFQLCESITIEEVLAYRVQLSTKRLTMHEINP